MLAICSCGCIEASSPLGAFCKQIVSGHGLFPLMRLLPLQLSSQEGREGGSGQSQAPWPACTKVAHTAPLPKRCGQHLPPPRQGVGHRDLSRSRNSEQSSTSTKASLGRNGRRKQGVVLSYVTSFLRVRGPGVSQPSPLGRGWGRGRHFLPCLCCLSSRPRQISVAGLLPKRPSSKEAPPARELGTKKGVVVRVCGNSGLLASLTENQALSSSLAP